MSYVRKLLGFQNSIKKLVNSKLIDKLGLNGLLRVVQEFAELDGFIRLRLGPQARAAVLHRSVEAAGDNRT